MTTAEQYDEMVEALAEVQQRNSELETRNTGQLMRIDELMQAVEDVNRAGVLKIRELDRRCSELYDRLALLEAVREAACKVRTIWHEGCDVGLALAEMDLDVALAAVENDVTPQG